MKIKLKTLSPVHIGSGEEISPLEYLIDNKFIRINMDALFKDSDFQPLKEKFISSAIQQRYIGDLLPVDLLRKYPLYILDIHPSTKDYLKEHKTIVKSFIKSAGRPYIPGSSIKGSILSAVVWYVLSEAVKVGKRTEVMNFLVRGGNYEDFLDYTFRRFAKGNRFTQWLDVTDTNFLKPNDALEITLAKVTGARRSGMLPILFETLKISTEFDFEIKRKNVTLEINDLIQIVSQFYQRVLQKSKQKIKTDFSGYLLRIGQGSSAFATSLLILAEDLKVKSDYIRRWRVTPHGDEPRTEKLIDNTPLGWVEMRYV
ncbi:MAG TPA: type III-A CRISPR-associated RAMP protein Csm5 [Elusimicrobia bacterium]|jgi:CRISPR type III-A-associated RAMP protein Csm5|nr:type III-A CRISPR-associated RAMP protein Csm5 [Elusimicrobiota bacterium]